ncbi:MAG: YjbQ family protein [Acidimicrobiales bacterium]
MLRRGIPLKPTCEVATDTEDITIHTGRQLVTDVTAQVKEFCRDKADGLCHAFLPHATAGLALIETGSGSEADLASALDRMMPRGGGYLHRHGSAGHGRDHLLPAFVCPSLVLAVREGAVVLGTWQTVVVVDTNVDNTERHLLLSFLRSPS